MISIPVPTYECKGQGWLFISELLNSIKKQTFTDYEVVISDQSTDRKTEEIIKFYSNEMNIVYLDSSHIDRKIGTNLNNAIRHCSGDIIKPMMADDFFIDVNALRKIYDAMQGSNRRWLAAGCAHANADTINFLYWRIIPSYHNDIHLGANTISSPSVIAMKDVELFDENLSLLIDCEMYKRLYTKYGEPIIIEDMLVANRMHENQMQKIDADLKDREVRYCIEKYTI